MNDHRYVSTDAERAENTAIDALTALIYDHEMTPKDYRDIVRNAIERALQQSEAREYAYQVFVP